MSGFARKNADGTSETNRPCRIHRRTSPRSFLLFCIAAVLLVSPHRAGAKVLQDPSLVDLSRLSEIESWGFSREEYLSLVNKCANLNTRQEKIVGLMLEDPSLVQPERILVQQAQRRIENELYMRRAAVRNLSPEQFRQQGIHTRMIHAVQNELDATARLVENMEQRASKALGTPTRQNQGYQPQPGNRTRLRNAPNDLGNVPLDQQPEINRQATGRVNGGESPRQGAENENVTRPAVPSGGTAGSAAGSTTKAPPVTPEPPPWNPSYTGPPSMNDPRAQGNWTRPPQAGSQPAAQAGSQSSLSQIRQAVEEHGAGAIVAMANLETIIKCIDAGTTARDCLCQIMVQNGIAASAAMALQLLSAGTIVKLALIGEVGAYIYLAYQLEDALYRVEDWASAEWNRYQIERNRREWTERNLRVREPGEDIEALRRRIHSTLEPLLYAVTSGCRELEDQAAKAARSGSAAREEAERLPLAEAIEAYKQYEEKTFSLILRQGRQGEAAEKIRQALDLIRQELGRAAALAENCDTAESAKAVADKHKSAVQALQSIRQFSAEAQALAESKDSTVSGMQHVRTTLTEAFAMRDRISSLVSEPASHQQMETTAASVNAAMQQLQEQGARLANEVRALRRAFPENLETETKARLRELVQEVVRIQGQASCDTEPILGRYASGMGDAIDAKLEAENRLRPVEALYTDLSRLPPGKPAVANDLQEMVQQAEALLLDHQDLPQIAIKCLQLASNSGSNQPQGGGDRRTDPGEAPAGGDFTDAGTKVNAVTVRSGGQEHAPEKTPAKPPATSDVTRQSDTNRQDPGFSDAGTNVSRLNRQSETVTYFERPWMPLSWKTGGNSTEVRVNIYETASRLGWAAALAEFTDGVADPMIADHLRAATNHVLAVNRNAFGPLKPWPDWQQIQARHEEWAQRIAQGSRASRDYFRKGLHDTILGHGTALARALAYQAAGELEQRENCDSYYFRIGYHLAYAAQSLNLAAEGKANSAADLWIQRVISRGQSNAQTAANYIQDLRKVKPATGYCIDLMPVQTTALRAASGHNIPGENAAAAIKAWNDVLALLSGAGMQTTWECSGELEGMWVSTRGNPFVYRFVKKGDAYEGIFTHVNPGSKRLGYEEGKTYIWVQKLDDRNYRGKQLMHRWPGHQGDTWPYGVTVLGDYFLAGVQTWTRIKPGDVSKIQLIRSGQQDYFIIPGYPKIESADTVPDCRKGPVSDQNPAGRRPGEAGGNSIKLLDQRPQ